MNLIPLYSIIKYILIKNEIIYQFRKYQSHHRKTRLWHCPVLMYWYYNVILTCFLLKIAKTVFCILNHNCWLLRFNFCMLTFCKAFINNVQIDTNFTKITNLPWKYFDIEPKLIWSGLYMKSVNISMYKNVSRRARLIFLFGFGERIFIIFEILQLY